MGYIQIDVSAQDVFFDIYCSSDNRYYVKSRQKHFMSLRTTIGTHFPILDKSDKEIKKEIALWLERIKKDFLNRRYYLDETTFSNIIDYIDIRHIIDDIK
jgi:hypothetical protein